MFRIVFTIYPRCTQLDFAGPYEVFSRVPDTEVVLASPDGGEVVTEHGLTLCGTETLTRIEKCDLICVPGGLNQSRIMAADALDEIRRLARLATYVTSVCNGSLVLAAAGLLEGRRSACHWAVLDQLASYGALPDPGRVARDGPVITGAGVTSGIDFGLTCAAEICGEVQAQLIQLMIEYAPEPPFAAGHPSTAPQTVLAALHAMQSEND